MSYNFLPTLKHDLVYSLCLAPVPLKPEVIEAILLLPREELLTDIDLLLQCLLEDNDKLFEELENVDEVEFKLLIHCMFFLSELSARELLSTVLKIMELDEESIDFWFEGFYETDFSLTLMPIIKDDLNIVFEFLKKPNKCWYSPELAAVAIQNLGHNFPEKNQEIKERTNDLLDFVSSTPKTDPRYHQTLFTSYIYLIGAYHGESFKEKATLLFEAGKFDETYLDNFPIFIAKLENNNFDKFSIKTIYENYDHYFEKNVIGGYEAEEFHEARFIIPAFQHRELLTLYSTGLDIPPTALKKILSLPKESLIKDVELILHDFIIKVPLFEKSEKLALPHWIPIHCLFILAELKSHKSLQLIFKLFSLSEYQLYILFEDFIIKRAWQVLDDLYSDNILEFEYFVLHTPEAWQGKAAIFRMLQQRHIHHPKERSRIIAIFAKYIDQEDFTQKVIDEGKQGFNSLFLQRLLELRDPLFLPVAKEMFREKSNYRMLTIFKDKYFSLWLNQSIVFPPLNKTSSIFQRYSQEESILNGILSRTEQQMQSVTGNEISAKAIEKISRNAPCPCGSGKKWKRCCGQ